MIKRKSFRLIHLYLGLVSGLVVFMEAITGCCWVFHEEIESFIHPEIEIRSSDLPILTPTEVKTIAEVTLPGKAIHGVLYENDEKKPIEVIYYEAGPEFHYSVFLDPHDGAVLKHLDHKEGFLAFVLDGHLNLWLPPAIGKQIVSYGTLMFMLSIITGIILWWPKNKKARRQRFRFSWKESTRWRRKNFDLHTVVGFYVSALAMIFVVTGLVMALNWFYFLYYTALGGDSEMRFIIPQNVSAQASLDSVNSQSIDRLLLVLKENYPAARDYEIHFPHADSLSIYVEVSYQDGVYYDSDFVFFDQQTLEEVPTPSIYGKYENADLQDHVMRMNYDIHVGGILGLPTKILAFLASLIIASLPVTGLVIWIGRINKERGVASRRKGKVCA